MIETYRHEYCIINVLYKTDKMRKWIKIKKKDWINPGLHIPGSSKRGLTGLQMFGGEFARQYRVGHLYQSGCTDTSYTAQSSSLTVAVQAVTITG